MKAHVPALVVDAVVRDGDVCITEDHYRAKRLKAAKAWGDGVVLKVRIEPAEDAYTFAQIKFYFGRIVQPLVEHTGYRKDEWHVMLKAAFMPDGKSSITQLNRKELTEYTEACEQYAREAHPDAFTLYDPMTGAA